MDRIPVEIVGEILSRIEGAHNVVIASTTCKKWQEAFRNHLHTLSFDYRDWPIYPNISTTNIELIITHTIFHTTGLQNLTIIMDDRNMVSTAITLAWLMHTRNTLRSLSYDIKTNPNVNILQIFLKKNLEELVLANNIINGINPTLYKFPYLKYLSLTFIIISAFNLNLLFNACPIIETLDLVDLANPEPNEVKVEMRSSTLKSLYIHGVNWEKFILEANSIEYLHLKFFAAEHFELIGNETLKHFKLKEVDITNINITRTSESLEVVDFKGANILWQEICKMISRSKKLKKLRLWDVDFSVDGNIDVVSIAASFSQRLTYLSLRYDVDIDEKLQENNKLVNVTVLELGYTPNEELFSIWVEKLLRKCPNLKKLILCNVISETITPQQCQLLARFTLSIIQLMRKYINVELQFRK